MEVRYALPIQPVGASNLPLTAHIQAGTAREEKNQALNAGAGMPGTTHELPLTPGKRLAVPSVPSGVNQHPDC